MKTTSLDEIEEIKADTQLLHMYLQGADLLVDSYTYKKSPMMRVSWDCYIMDTKRSVE